MNSLTLIYEVQVSVDVPETMTDMHELCNYAEEREFVDGNLMSMSLHDKNGEQIKEWVL